jgi:chemotaxis protein CheD
MTAWDQLAQPDVPVVQVTLKQGEIQFGIEPTVLVTILGSCVAVCLWDSRCRVGGMNHFVLPSDPKHERNPRYGDVAIDELIAGLRRNGSRVSDLQAKIFGGAAVLPAGGIKSVGTSNVLLALERLSYERIPITGRRTGGTLGQQIRFHTGSGDVFFRYLPGSIRAEDV